MILHGMPGLRGLGSLILIPLPVRSAVPGLRVYVEKGAMKTIKKSDVIDLAPWKAKGGEQLPI